jgi:hypothetical protein
MENKNKTVILGMTPVVFYSVSGVFVLLLGYGIYSIIKK